MPIRTNRPPHHIATPGLATQFSRASCAVLFLSLALCAPRLSAQMVTHSMRTLSGTVTSPDHEPIRGAVVELQEVAGGTVESYITSEDGHYHFKRLNSEADYKVWVIFRNRHSKSKEISKFDSHLDKVIDFTIETF